MKESDVRSHRLSTFSYAPASSAVDDLESPPAEIYTNDVESKGGRDLNDNEDTSPRSEEVQSWPIGPQSLATAPHLDVIRTGWLEKKRALSTDRVCTCRRRLPLRSTPFPIPLPLSFSSFCRPSKSEMAAALFCPPLGSHGLLCQGNNKAVRQDPWQHHPLRRQLGDVCSGLRTWHCKVEMSAHERRHGLGEGWMGERGIRGVQNQWASPRNGE